MSHIGNEMLTLICMRLDVILDLVKRHRTKPWSLKYFEQIVVDVLGHLSTSDIVFDHLMLL